MPRDKTVFALSPTKTAEFEVKNRRKSAKEASITFAVCYFCLFFEVIKQIRKG